MSSLDACVICNDSSGTLVQVTSKGLATLIHYCELRASNDLGEYLQHQYASSAKMFVHKDCRRDFTNPRRVKTSINSSASEQGLLPQNLLRSKQAQFDWKTKCWFVQNL